jgi:GNAT superfamily N-acetyltransferase
MMAIPQLIPSVPLMRRVSEAALAYTLARMRVLESIPGNPVGIAYRAVGDATALSARDLPSPSFNSVVGLRAGQAHLVEELIRWQREQGANGRFEIAAGDYDSALGRELARMGFYQSGFHAALIGQAPADIAVQAAVSVERVTDTSEMEDFLEAYVKGWSIPEEMRDQFKANVRPWFSQPDWSLYMAKIDAKPAGTAILFLRQGVGYFADSATDPRYRNRGLHAALLARRWRDAMSAGVDFVCSGADFLSNSHRNMERAGMRLLFLRAIWTPLV